MNAKKRIVVLGALVALVAGLSPVAGEAAPAEPPIASASRVWRSLDGYQAEALALDPGTGKAWVLTGGDLRVENPADVTDVTILPGPYGPPVAAGGKIYAYRDGSLRAIDPVTYSVATSWPTPNLDESLTLIASGNSLVWVVRDASPGTGSTAYRLNLANGVIESSANAPAYPYDGPVAGGSRLIGWTDSPGRLMEFDGIEPGAFTAAGVDELGMVQVTSDGGMVIGVDFEHSEIAEYEMPGFYPTGVRYDIDDGAMATAVTLGGYGALAVLTASSPAPLDTKLRVFAAGNEQPVMDVDVPGITKSDVRSLQFSADGKQLFLLVDGLASTGRPAQLIMADLTSVTIDAAQPQVVGTKGGAKVSVVIRSAVGGSLTLDGNPIATDIVKGQGEFQGATNDEVTFTVPAMTPGTKLLWFRNALAHQTTAGPLHAVDLGPFVNAPWFVRKQIQDITGTKATAAQVNAGVAELAAATTPGELIADLQVGQGQATQSAALIRLYRAVFLRPPDTAGLTYWTGRMAGGTRLVQVAATFAASSEFQNRYGELSNSAFVDRIYQNVLGRPADAGGRTYWIGKLSTGTSRGVLVAQFAQSGEHVTKSTVDVQRIELRVAMLAKTPTEAQLAPLRSMDLDDVAWQFLNDPAYSTN